MAKPVTNYIQANNYIDTSCQKAGIPGFPGCVEHSAMIWEQIQTAKWSKSDLHVVWLDLANSYGSVPNQLIQLYLNFFHIPPCIRSLVATYFTLHRLVKGIAMDCSISPILFTAAFEIILIGAQMFRGVRSQAGQ